MNTTAIKNNITSNKNLITLFVLLLFTSVNVFGQEVKNEIAVPVATQTTQVANAGSEASSQMELVSWFMGTKQAQGVQVLNTTSTNNSGKKQFVNSGMTPNRILSRTFLKKVINHDSTIS